MLNVFSLASGRLFQEEIESLQALAAVQPVWVDLEAPTPEEKGWIAQHFGVTIPEDAVDDDLEESARFYEEDNGELHIRSDFLIGDTDTPRNVRVAFILFKGVLFSVHAEALPVFRLLKSLRGLRGTAFDLFGYTDERRTERALIAEYEADIERIVAKLSPANHSLAVQIAAIPEDIRGFGHVKSRHLAAARKKHDELIASFENSGTERAAA